MRKITADYIYPVISEPISNGIVVIDDDGKILDVLSEGAASEVEKFAGVLVPGFVNTHCHIELSYLKGSIPTGIGLNGFIKQIEAIRNNFTEDDILKSLEQAEEEMIRNGIVAVGDISNSEVSFSQKAKNNLYYHTFIEVLGFHPDGAEQAFSKGIALQQKCESLGLKSSVTPHSPYAASEKLLAFINDLSGKQRSILSFHNQESEEENQMFQKKTGKILKQLEDWKISTQHFHPFKTNSIQFVLPRLNKSSNVLPVHNTFTSREDIEWLREYRKSIPTQEQYFCICPKANLYIESRLPDISLLYKEGLNITIGTDSLSSNDSLSVLAELKTISQRFPEISFAELIKWSTLNGAKFLGIENKFGSIEKGKTPGLNLLKKDWMKEGVERVG